MSLWKPKVELTTWSSGTEFVILRVVGVDRYILAAG